METDIIKQEILLVINAFHNELCEKSDSKSQHKSKREQLEEACWSGLLSDLLPGVIGGEKLFIWNIQQGKSFLEVELCEYPQDIENKFSIDPYVFLPATCEN